MIAQPVARIAGVSHRYGKTLALSNVDLAIPSGCMVGFIGPDGVGKSSLLALISGARKIQSGTIEAMGGDMRSASHRSAVCPRIAYMPQGLGRNLYPTLSVFENVDFFGRLFGHARKERHERIAELLAATDLTAFADRPAAKLSGGMKQKLGLCCALIHDPDLLILDEPTTGVDPLSRRQFWNLIDQIRQRRPGMSVLVATAYMEEAERFDWLVAMHGGAVLATGSADDLKAATATDTLEQAFVSMLPEGERGDGRALEIPPRAPDGHEIAIEAKGLTMRFGDFTAVQDVNLRVERGEIFGFLGSNGCGKTTTMKMLTGLLPPSAGEAALFGQPLDARNIATRRRVGYMSQAFSLYTELTVRQNLDLHARLFALEPDRIPARIGEMVERFDLGDYVDQRPDSLPLGIRQRLSLAVAVIHSPEMLILDEPTSGVDPVARDAFWRLLLDLSRNDGVTIFISTHFMNEAERCDRISLMHAGRVLTEGTPEKIRTSRQSATLDDAFVAYLQEATTAGRSQPAARGESGEPPVSPIVAPGGAQSARPPRFSLARLWAYGLRESMEILRDPIRLSFALFGPLLLMIVFGFGISFDVENMSFAALDHDRTPESRAYLENFEASRYFVAQAPLLDHADLERRMKSGSLKVAIEIPPGFGRDLKRGSATEIGAWVDGAMPSRAETSRGYVESAHQAFLANRLANEGRGAEAVLPFDAEVRFRYNPSFESVYAMVPGVIMLLLIYIPSMMTALGVVREREMGSITNLYVTPVTGIEFLLGKQMPYAAIAMINFVCLLMLALFLFDVPVRGSLLVLTLGAAIYVVATTGFGLLISTFVTTQVAAIFATGILTMLPAVQYSGIFTPVSSLSGGARVMGLAFPSTYFQIISLGSFTKALGASTLMINFAALFVIIAVYLMLARLRLRTQER